MRFHPWSALMRLVGTNTFNDDGPRHPPGDGWKLRFGPPRDREWVTVRRKASAHLIARAECAASRLRAHGSIYEPLEVVDLDSKTPERISVRVEPFAITRVEELKPNGDPSYVAVWQNDAFELWLGTPDRWHTHYRRAEARRLARWILWCWARELFGIRRAIYCFALRRVVRRHARPGGA